MKICVLSGSPKGENSITYQTILYLAKKYKNDEFHTLHVGAKMNYYEKNPEEALSLIKECDVILFCYPVYTFLVPYQLHRFIEVMKENNVDCKGKYAFQISTSKHFYDVTAHEFIQENCYDLDLKYMGGLSLDMDDLTKEEGRKEIRSFYELMQFRYEHDYHEKKKTYDHSLNSYESSLEGSIKEGNDTVIVASIEEGDTSLISMIEDFRKIYPYSTKVININEAGIRGGCIGCLNCATTGKCIYKDGFEEMMKNEIHNKNAIVYAFTLKDHSMGSMFKKYDDRQFCNGHRTLTVGTPVGYIVNGNLKDEDNLKTVIKARCDVGRNYLAGIATDPSSINELAKTLAYAKEHEVTLPQTFYGVGGTKIFRDLIYLMQGMMTLDYQFYKKNGMLDFPQDHKGTILKMKLVGKIFTNEKVKKKIGDKITEGMLLPYKKVLEEED